MTRCDVSEFTICVYRNSSYSRIFRAKARSGDTVDFTGKKFKMEVRPNAGSPTILATYTSESTPPELEMVDGETNQFRLFINSDKTAEHKPGTFHYDIFEYEDESDTDKKARLRGPFIVLDSVTRFE